MIDLAIIIPAYKHLYFERTLDSIAQQSNRNFNVYIGDDCSPFDLKKVVCKYEGQLNIFYKRFSNNIGARDLVLHWRRCIELVTIERWIWLFSDDDLMDKNCVENFYLTLALKKDRFDVYRFNVVTIGSNDDILQKNVIGPEEESSEEMAYYLLNGKRSNSMPDHIFSRDIYNKKGLVFTEYAQGADWATSILFSQNKGISTIAGSNVFWRYSGTNISSTAHKEKNSILGHLQFINWTLTHFEYLIKTDCTITYQMILTSLRDNLTSTIINHYKGINISKSILLFKVYRNDLKMSKHQSILEVIKILKMFNPIILKLIIFKKRMNFN